MTKRNCKRSVLLIVSIIMIMSLFGCGRTKDEPVGSDVAGIQKSQDLSDSTQRDNESSVLEIEEKSSTRVFTDSCGREIVLPGKITRVAVSGPLTEIVFFGFAPELMIGWSSTLSSDSQSYIPREYAELPRLGQLYGGKGSLNLEELLAAAPDIVVDIGEPKDSVGEDMDALQQQTGIPFVHIDAFTESMDQTFLKLGELTGLTERSLEYAEYCRKVLERTKSIVAQVGSDKVRALYCLGDAGCNVIARGSYHAEIIDMLTDNPAVVDNPSAKGSGNEVDPEQILNWDPDFIIFAPDSIADTVEDNAFWKELTPIKEGKYVKVPGVPYNWMGFPPSVQRYLGMIWLTKTLYPEYADYDLQQEIAEYFRMFYHIELTDEQYRELMR